MSRGLPAFPAGSVVTCGSFDGVHLGHQAVLREVKARAERLGAASVVVTFEPHPASVLSKQGAPLRLTTREEQAEFLAELGLDYLLVLRFDRGLADQSAEEFVRDTLLAEFGMRELVLGENHALGRDRRGDSGMLPELGRRMGFGVTVIGPVPDARGEPISSTRIRDALVAGELGAVAEWLGRPYRVTGRVLRGAGLGRTIGVPTINLEGPPPEKALPPDGVYAARVEWGGGTAGAMLNQGPRPTVGEMQRTVEANLFGMDEDLYGRTVRIEWVKRLRDVQRFPSLDALRAQLALDRAQAVATLAGFPETSTARPTGAR